MAHVRQIVDHRPSWRFGVVVIQPHTCKAIVMRAITVFMCGLAGPASASDARPRIDVVQILHQFVQAETAERLCEPDKKLSTIFIGNREAVTVRATQALIQRDPTRSVANVKLREAVAIAKKADDTSALVKGSGCLAPEPMRLLKLYQVQSTVDLAAAPK